MPSLKYVFHKSPLKPLIARARRLWAKANDLALNIETMDGPQPDGGANAAGAATTIHPRIQSKYNDGVEFSSPDYSNVRKVARLLGPTVTSDDVFYDVGSGKGRIVCVMARRPFKKVVGIELREDLCEVARQNAASLRNRKAPVEIVCEDASLADMSDGTVYFLFNPFGRDTLREVCQHIRESLANNPRAIRIVYYNAEHEDVLESDDWLVAYKTFNTLTGMRVSLWRNKPLEAPTDETIAAPCLAKQE